MIAIVYLMRPLTDRFADLLIKIITLGALAANARRQTPERVFGQHNDKGRTFADRMRPMADTANFILPVSGKESNRAVDLERRQVTLVHMLLQGGIVEAVDEKDIEDFH